MADIASPVRSVDPILPGRPTTPGRGVLIACSVAGTVRLVMEQAGFLDVYAPQGSFELMGYRVKDVNAAGTTATATVTVLY